MDCLLTQTALEKQKTKKNRLDRFKITFLIRHYNDIVLYMVPPVKIGVRAATQGVFNISPVNSFL